MNRVLLAVFALALSFGCSSIDPVLKQRTDDNIGRFRAGSPKTLAAPSSNQVPDWEVGQYVVLLSTADQEPSLMKITVQSKDSNGIWIEYQTLGYRSKGKQRLLFREQPRTVEQAKTAVRKMEIFTGDETTPSQVHDFEDPNNPMAGFMRDTMASVWSNLVLDTSTANPETVTVPAGTFNGAIPYQSRVTLFGSTYDVQGHVHYAVPVNGAVKGRSTDGRTSIELLDFGNDASAPALF
jgi:hypothetical protein